MKKEKLRLIIGGVAALAAIYLGYRYFIKPKAAGTTATPVSGDSTNILDSQVAPGEIMDNSKIENIHSTSSTGVVSPAGYGYDPSKNVFTWIGQGMPPNGAFTIPVTA